MNRQTGHEASPERKSFDFSAKGSTGLRRIISGKGRGFSIATFISVSFLLVMFLSWRTPLPLVMIFLLLAQYSIAAIEISFDEKTISVVTWRKEKVYELAKIKRIIVSHHKMLYGLASMTLRQRYKLHFYLVPSPGFALDDHDPYLELKQYVDCRFNPRKS